MLAGLLTSWKKLPRLGLSHCEEEMGISRWNHIVLIAQVILKPNIYPSVQPHWSGFCEPVRKSPHALFGAGIECVSVHFGGKSAAGMKYTALQHSCKRQLSVFAVGKLAAQCELEGLLYRPAFCVGTRCLSKDADEFWVRRKGKDSLATLILQTLLWASRVLQPAMGSQYGESGLPRNVSLYLECYCVFSFFSLRSSFSFPSKPESVEIIVQMTLNNICMVVKSQCNSDYKSHK